MQDRDEAEQIFCDYLYSKGFVGNEDEVKVRRLDFNQNWTVLINNQVFGNCDYDNRINRFNKLKINRIKPKMFKVKMNKEEYNIGSFLKQNGIKTR